MGKKQKAQKQSLLDFLGGENWADDEVDIGSISVQIQPSKQKSGFSEEGENTFGRSGDSEFGSRAPRKEFPVPDVAPFKAKINNVPWDGDENLIGSWFEERLGVDTFTNLQVPKEPNGNLRGYAFLTFNTRDLLLQAMELSSQEMNGRKIFIAVAAPGSDRDHSRRPPQEEFDWSVRRGPMSDDFNDRRPSRRGHQNDEFGEGRPPRRGPPREREPEPEFDWGVRRAPVTAEDKPRFHENGPPRRKEFTPRERREREPEPEFDWGVKRAPVTSEDKPRFHENGQSRKKEFTPRERRERAPEPEFDWGVKRAPVTAEDQPAEASSEGNSSRRRSFKKEARPKTEEPDLDWSDVRRHKVVTDDNVRKERDNSGRNHSNKGKKQDNLNWDSIGATRSGFTSVKKNGGAKAKAPEVTASTKESSGRSGKSMYDILSNDIDEDNDDDELANKTSKLSV